MIVEQCFVQRISPGAGAGGLFPLSVYKKYQNETDCAVSFPVRSARRVEQFADIISKLFQLDLEQCFVKKAGNVILQSSNIML